MPAGWACFLWGVIIGVGVGGWICSIMKIAAKSEAEREVIIKGTYMLMPVTRLERIDAQDDDGSITMH